jgi:hypothetical protein
MVPGVVPARYDSPIILAGVQALEVVARALIRPKKFELLNKRIKTPAGNIQHALS